MRLKRTNQLVTLEADRAVALLNNGDAAGALESMASCLIRLAEINPDGSLRAAYYHRVVRHAVLVQPSDLADHREAERPDGGEHPRGRFQAGPGELQVDQAPLVADHGLPVSVAASPRPLVRDDLRNV